MQRKLVLILTLVFISSGIACSQTYNKQIDSNCQNLKTCLLKLNRIKEPKNISQSDVDTLVHHLLTYDECAYLDEFQKMINAALARVVKSAKYKESYIKSLITLELSLKSTNAYLAKLVSSYVLSGAKNNPNGFLDAYLDLNEHDSQIILDCLSQEDNYDLAKIYDNYANSDRSNTLRQAAQRISSYWRVKHFKPLE
jgi:hypothetical protein